MAGEWKKFQLGQIGSVVTGRTPPGTLPEYFGDAVPFVTPSDMDGRRKVHETARSLSVQGSEILKRVIVQRGVAVSCIGWQMGKAVLIDMPAATNQQINTLVPEPKLADDLFVYYALTSERDAIFRLGAGGSRTPILNKSGFEAFEITLPPLAEQKAIAAVLGALDDKIELNRRMNATLEAMARALFQSWFVDFDPVRAKLDGRKPIGLDETTASFFPDSFQESSLGHTPKGWEVRSLDKTAHYLNGLALQKYPSGDGPTLPVIKIAQLRKGDSVGADRCNTELPANYIVQDGDVLFSWSGSLEVELWCGGPGALNQHLFKVTSPEFPKWFYYLWTLCHLDEFRLIAAGKATTMGHIQRGHLTAAKVLIPPRPLLDAMTRTMSPLIDQLIANRIQSRILATLRDTLLPKLLSGELSVAASLASTRERST